MAGQDQAGRCADPAERGPPSRAEGRAGFAALLVELAVQVQPLKDELHRGGDRGRVSGRADLCDGALHARYLQRLLHVLLAREGGGDVHRRAALKCGEIAARPPCMYAAVSVVTPPSTKPCRSCSMIPTSVEISFG